MFSFKSVDCDIQRIVKKFGMEDGGEAQKFIDQRVLELCAPLVPKDNNILIDSGNIATQIGSGEVKYNTPYARRWYYMPAQFQEAPVRGTYWFERMKKQGGKETILEGLRKMAGQRSGN